MRLDCRSRCRRTLCFTDELVIRTQQPAQYKQNAKQTAEQYGDERGEQDRFTRARRLRRERVEKNGKQRRQQEESRQHGQAGLEAAAVFHFIRDLQPELSGVPINYLRTKQQRDNGCDS
jgi:hypothetical protein